MTKKQKKRLENLLIEKIESCADSIHIRSIAHDDSYAAEALRNLFSCLMILEDFDIEKQENVL